MKIVLNIFKEFIIKIPFFNGDKRFPYDNCYFILKKVFSIIFCKIDYYQTGNSNMLQLVRLDNIETIL